ncbi:hypothetical protein ABE504_21410 [Paenibacillus oryzisoli]|uniref:hypothetical protein n=1 Tax=Paenibacillus oryzisoli TaxID=1850517 RepID=UPI003D28061D
MATYVVLIKKFEDETRVVYKFGPSEENLGEIEFNKKTEDFTELVGVTRDPQGHDFMRAVSALVKCYRSGEGFPDRTFFAS